LQQLASSDKDVSFTIAIAIGTAITIPITVAGIISITITIAITVSVAVGWFLILVMAVVMRVFFILLVMMMVVRPFWAALLVAFKVARLAGLVAGVGLLDDWAHLLGFLCHNFWLLGKLLVQPGQVKLRALLAVGILALFMASLDRRPLLASLQEWCPWLWALVMAIDICATLLVASMSLLHLVMHPLVPLLVVPVVVLTVVVMVMPVVMLIIVVMVVVMPMVVVVLVMIVAMVAMMVPFTKWMWTLVVALVVSWRAGLVALVCFEDLWALFLRLLRHKLWCLGILPVHPLLLELRALVTIRVFALVVARLDRWEILTCLDKGRPRLRALGVAVPIGSTLHVTPMCFLHLVMHLLMPMPAVTVMMPMRVTEILREAGATEACE